MASTLAAYSGKYQFVSNRWRLPPFAIKSRRTDPYLSTDSLAGPLNPLLDRSYRVPEAIKKTARMGWALTYTRWLFMNE
jgi:hypothetical protein